MTVSERVFSGGLEVEDEEGYPRSLAISPRTIERMQKIIDRHAGQQELPIVDTQQPTGEQL